MALISFKIDIETKDKIIDFYKDYQKENNGLYICFFAKTDDFVVTIYESKKGYKVVFNGKNAEYEASIFSLVNEETPKKEKINAEYLTFSSQIGSDEVGFGDFFGPLVVVGVYFDESLLNILSSIKDSKKLSDSFILNFVPQIIDKVSFSKLTVHNEKYNEMINKGYNMNDLKALLHNRVLVNLRKKHPQCNNFYIDQFCNEDTYYRYIQFEEEKVLNLTFKTKGESYYPSIALASMIARYSFLKEMEVLNKKYALEFPKGASRKVDEFVQLFIEKYSKDELIKVCKTNFINYKNL